MCNNLEFEAEIYIKIQIQIEPKKPSILPYLVGSFSVLINLDLIVEYHHKASFTRSLLKPLLIHLSPSKT